jgi:hypothetical protein
MTAHLKISKSVPIILFVLLSMFPFNGQTADIKFKIKNCASLLKLRLQLLLPVTGLNPHFEIHDPLVAQWVEKMRIKYEADSPLKSGQIFTFKNNSYEVVATLGAGHQGVATLVKSTEGLRILKKFYAPLLLTSSLGAHHRLQISGRMELPKIVEFDWGQGLALLDYFEGIPLSYIVEHAEEFGISDEKMESIKSRGYQMANGPGGMDDVIYAPAQDRLRYIEDP